MLRIRESAPRFDCTAIVESEIVDLTWEQLHENQILVLLFDSVDGCLDRPDGLATLCDAASRFAILQCKLAVVCRDDEFSVLTWMQRMDDQPGARTVDFPVIVDSDSQIVSLYDMLSVDGPLWGHVIADANARVRSLSAYSQPVGVNVDELIRCVASILESDDC